MVAELLPGIRDIRAQLAAGYLWMVWLWITFGPRIPGREEAAGFFASLYQILDAVNFVGIGIGASFIAYLVGSFSQGLFHRLLLWAAKLLGKRAVLFYRLEGSFSRVSSEMDVGRELVREAQALFEARLLGPAVAREQWLRGTQRSGSLYIEYGILYRLPVTSEPSSRISVGIPRK